VNEIPQGQTAGIVLERSPFYGESGGQIGDTGTIESPKGAADVVQTTWVDDVLVHHARVRQGRLKVQEPVRARVDADRRLKIARSHTATHLLHWALRKVLGPEAVQAGSAVEPDRLRFDVSSLQPLREEQRAEVEALVNARVRLADPVRTDITRLEEAKRIGALAMFGEKYGEQVRVVTIGDYSKELCGGTHLSHTGFVGVFTIVAESSIAAGTRRIEALVGEAASARHQEDVRLLQEASKVLGGSPEQVIEGLRNLLGKFEHGELEVRAKLQARAKVDAGQLVAEAKEIGGIAFVAVHIKQVSRETLAMLADAIKGSLQKDGVVLLASGDGGQAAFVVATTAGVAKRVPAGEVVKEIASLMQGSGGGRPDFAQGGGRDPAGIPAALRRAEEFVRAALEKA
jgi:alanyl-tRNA synthetase